MGGCILGFGRLAVCMGWAGVAECGIAWWESVRCRGLLCVRPGCCGAICSRGGLERQRDIKGKLMDSLGWDFGVGFVCVFNC